MPRPPGERFYGALIFLLPPRFRMRHQEELRRTFREMRAGWEEERGRVGLGFWVALVWDVVRAAGSEWLSLMGYTIRSATTANVGDGMAALLGDVRFALRQLVRQPLYASMIVVLMALGIAGNAAVFRVFNGLFLKPLPFDASEQLVDINETAPAWDLEYLQVAYRDFDAWREDNGTFQSMAAYTFGGGNLVTDDGASRVSYVEATHDIDDVLSLEPIVGRFFGPEEDVPDGPRSGLVSEAYWRQNLGADPDVVGRTVALDGHLVEILGVLPPEARFLGEADLWLPMQADPDEFQGWGLAAIGRLRPDVSIEQARADLTSVHKGLIERWEVNEISSPVLDSLRDRYLGDFRLGSGVLLGAVAIVLLLACANIAGLMTARSLARAPEMGVRLALGAPRGRIVRQLLTESVVLGCMGAVAGVLLGVWGSNALVARLQEQFPTWVSFDLDARFLLFTLVVTLGAAIAFGLAPALSASRNPGSVVATRVTSSLRRRRAMGMLVVGEVALALVLLVVGGLSMVDVRRLGQADPGFDVAGIMTFGVNLPTLRYEDGPARLSFAERYVEGLSGLPGVSSAAVASSLPLSGHWGWFFVVDGAPPRAEDEANPVVLNRVVSPSYFETMGVTMVAGRALDSFDGRDETAPVVVVNQTFVRTHLAHLDDPVGARIHPSTDMPDSTATWMTVVGVARDVKHYGLDEEMRPGVYQPLAQLPLAGFEVAVRTQGDDGSVMQAARAYTAGLDVELPLHSVARMTEQLDESLYTRRATSWLISIFSTVALLMAAAGIYGVISYTVGQRSREIGIRMAMGARRQSVVRAVVGQGMRPVAVGTLLGLLLSIAGAGLVSGLLVGISATDPKVYAAITGGLLLVATLANYLPARRAAGLDPIAVLRSE